MSGNDEHNSFWARVFAAGDSQPGEPACETRDRQRERFQSAQNLGIPTGRPVRERRPQAPPPSASAGTVERGNSAGALRTLCVVTFIIMCLALLIGVALQVISVAAASTMTVIGAGAMVIIVNFVIRD